MTPGHRYCLVLFSLLLALFPVRALDLDELKDQFEDVSESLDENLERVDQMRGNISTEEEIEIGANLTAGLLGAAPLVKSKKLQRYVNDVGFWIASQSNRPDLPGDQCLRRTRRPRRGYVRSVPNAGERGAARRGAGA